MGTRSYPSIVGTVHSATPPSAVSFEGTRLRLWRQSVYICIHSLCFERDICESDGGPWLDSQRILVTGGDGFLGLNLAQGLHARGHRVVSCDLHSLERDDYVRCDVREFRQLDRLFEEHKFDYVYHLA